MFGIRASIPMLAGGDRGHTSQPEVKETTVAIEVTISASTQVNSIPAQYSCYTTTRPRSSHEAGFPKAPKRSRSSWAIQTPLAAHECIGLSMAYPLTSVWGG
jgi:hypothetical protein